MATSLFERHGGFATVNKLVLAFYERVGESEILEPFFETVDMRRLIDHQTKFISSVMGGPASYTNQALEQVHGHLEIDRAAFEEMVLLLRETLEDFDFSAEEVEEVIRGIRERERFIVKS